MPDTTNRSRWRGTRRDSLASYLSAGAILLAVIVAWFAGGHHDSSTSVGFLTGMAAAIAVLLGFVWWARRRGGSSYSRGFDQTADERDKAIWQGAWAFTGKVAWFVPLLGYIAHLLGWEPDLGIAVSISLWVNAISLFASRYWLDRRM